MTPVDGVLCESYDPDYSALGDGELAPEREAELRAHLASCSRCRHRLATLERVDAELGALGSPSVPADLRARLQARIDAEADEERDTQRVNPPGRAAPRPRRRRLAATAAVAAVAAATALYLAVGAERSPLPTPGPETPPQIAEIPPSSPNALDEEPVEDVGVALDLETIEDLDLIANLELLEALVALEGGTG